MERRERYPYRSLCAEMLFQSLQDALAAEAEAPAPEELVEGSVAATSEAGRSRSVSRSGPAA